MTDYLKKRYDAVWAEARSLQQSSGQMKMLGVLFNERDEDHCREAMYELTGKESRTDLSWAEAGRLISYLQWCVPVLACAKQYNVF